MEARFRCRLFHSWFEAPSDWTPQLGVPFTLRCENCNTERRDTISPTTGDLVTRRYVYETGYRYGDAEHRLTRDELRLLLIQSAITAQRKRRKAS